MQIAKASVNVDKSRIAWCGFVLVYSERGEEGQIVKKKDWNDVVYRNTAEVQGVWEDSVPNGASLSWWCPFPQVLLQVLSLQIHPSSLFQDLRLSAFLFLFCENFVW